MKVRELIEALGVLNPDAEVVTTDCCYGPDLLTADAIEVKVMRTYTETYQHLERTLTRVADIIDEEFDLDPEDYPDVRKITAVVLN